MGFIHKPVLLNEVMERIEEIIGCRVLDLTFGEGGYSDALLDRGAGKVIGIDRDQNALQSYRECGKYKSDERLSLFHTRFSRFIDFVGSDVFDTVVMDLGVSSVQLADGGRGFSFMREGPLDMRLDRSSDLSLRDLILENKVSKIAGYLESAGEKKPEKMAAKLKEAVRAGQVRNTRELAMLAGVGPPDRHPATRLFLGLRMMVNEELEEIEATIPLAVKSLRPGGRLFVISFHSAEDRMVKRSLRKLAGKCACEDVICACPLRAEVELGREKFVVPTRSEIRSNPRSRSAKLRYATRVFEKTPSCT
jgi:16S rRNA (cytosine1402-N4)-methyltransferase